MATLEEEKEKRQELGKVLAELVQVKPEDLVRESELGRELNFDAGLPYFTRTLRLFTDLAQSNLDTIPFQRLNQLTNAARQALTQFQRVQTFSIQQHPQNPAGVRDQLIEQIRDSYDVYFDQISPIIAYSVRKGTDFQRLEDEARKAVERLNSIVADKEKSLTATLAEIEGTLEKVRRAAQEAGVAQHSIHFKDEANEHKLAARRWLCATAVLACLSTAFAGVSLYYYIYYTALLATLTGSQSIQLAVAKLIGFSVLLSATLWSGRIYRAHRHNYVVNKHRQNALSTFETFVKAAGNDEQTKNAVLLQATQCIFSPQHTGYITHEPDSGGYPQVLEIIRGISRSQEKG